MRVVMLVAADGTLTVSNEASRVDAQLLTGVNLGQLSGLDDLVRDVNEARRDGTVERSLKLWGSEWLARCEGAGGAVFVTLTREPPLSAYFPRIGFVLVDVLLSGQPLPATTGPKVEKKPRAPRPERHDAPKAESHKPEAPKRDGALPEGLAFKPFKALVGEGENSPSGS